MSEDPKFTKQAEMIYANLKRFDSPTSFYVEISSEQINDQDTVVSVAAYWEVPLDEYGDTERSSIVRIERRELE